MTSLYPAALAISKRITVMLLAQATVSIRCLATLVVNAVLDEELTGRVEHAQAGDLLVITIRYRRDLGDDRGAAP